MKPRTVQIGDDPFLKPVFSSPGREIGRQDGNRFPMQDVSEKMFAFSGCIFFAATALRPEFILRLHAA